MQIAYLAAALPLTKSIAKHGNEYVVTSYPQVSRVTSFHVEPTTLAEFHASLIAHAKLEHCLFNGKLTRPLENESRATMTLRGEPRDWVVFDFDKVDANGAEQAIGLFLPKECAQVSYIVQHSASMFVPGNTKFSGHIFMLLDKPITEKELLQWFEHTNFNVPALQSQLTLSSSGTSLHWPLDRTAAYDSKLIYVAPPRCYGFTPLFTAETSIKLVEKKKAKLSIGKYAPVEKHVIDAKINDLRELQGLQRREYNYRDFNGEPLLLNAEPGFINDVKPAGQHHIKFNLNGGQSMGYWIDLRNPEIIRNFKGEPNLRTQEVDEKFYNSLKKIAPRALALPPLDDNTEIFAFYAANRDAKVKTGWYKPAKRELRLDNSTENAARSWQMEYGVVPGPLKPWDLIFDPTRNEQYIPGTKEINMFKATTYMLQAASDKGEAGLSDLPPVIGKTIRSMLGNPDDALVWRFMNWLAWIFKHRTKSDTAWVLYGIQGTGKGTFVQFIIKPLFGGSVVRTPTLALLDTQFNDFLDGALFVVFDEASTSMVNNRSGMSAKLKNMITESTVTINKKNLSPFEMTNHVNVILPSNTNDPVTIDHKDRRYNVGKRQPERIFYTPNEWTALEGGHELVAFADILKRWPIDDAMVRTIDETNVDARSIHEATSSVGALIAEAIHRGDVQWFVDRIPSDAEALSDFSGQAYNPAKDYRALLDQIIAGGKAILVYEDLWILFRTLIPDKKYFQGSKTWRLKYLASLGLSTEPVYDPTSKKTIRGIKVNWVSPTQPPEKPAMTLSMGNNVVNIK